MKLISVYLLAVTLMAGSPVTAQDSREEAIATAKAAVDSYREDREKVILEDFVSLLSIPNVASNLPDMERNVEHIIELLEPRGFQTRRLSAGDWRLSDCRRSPGLARRREPDRVRPPVLGAASG